ncbi:MAG TPA: hypothetical protein VN841_29485 [Bryobacteraceae bacterium]|nr:hypothetical protein [Bryobacteraceae bacterium]
MLARNTQRVLLAALTVSSGLRADNKKTVEDQHVELIRGLTAEYATAKNGLPQAKKPLDFNADGTWDVLEWSNSARLVGVAARVGDLVQVTRVGIGKDTLLLEINGGLRGKRSFWDHVQMGGNVGISGGPVNGPPTNAPAGTAILLHFKGTIGDVTSSEVKKILTPMLDFEKHSATENYMDTLPPEIQEAVKAKKAIEGMDRDQVLLALGRPLRKTRETKDGVELEDWLYGEPPGRVTFVTFNGNKVLRVKETYAGLGGSVVDIKPVN